MSALQQPEGWEMAGTWKTALGQCWHERTQKEVEEGRRPGRLLQLMTGPLGVWGQVWYFLRPLEMLEAGTGRRGGRMASKEPHDPGPDIPSTASSPLTLFCLICLGAHPAALGAPDSLLRVIPAVIRDFEVLWNILGLLLAKSSLNSTHSLSSLPSLSKPF